MKLFDLFEGNEQAYNWHSEPEQRSMDATRSARLNREREPEGSEAIDARLRAQNDQLAQYAQSGNFWLKQKDTQQHISDVFVGKAAANAAALELLKQQPELKGNLVITAYGPDETQGVAESSDDSLPGQSKLSGATAAPAPNPALKNILMRHMDEVRSFVKYGEIDSTGDMFQDLYEYFANEIPEPVRRDPRRLERRIGNMIAPYAKFYASASTMNEQGVAEAPGAETLGHNQSTVASNLNSLDLDEGDISQLEKDIAAAPVAPIANMEGDEKIGGRYDADDFDNMVMRLKKLAGAGPMQTKYDPNKRVYRNVPTAQQPAQQPKK